MDINLKDDASIYIMIFLASIAFIFLSNFQVNDLLNYLGFFSIDVDEKIDDIKKISETEERKPLKEVYYYQKDGKSYNIVSQYPISNYHINSNDFVIIEYPERYTEKLDDSLVDITNLINEDGYRADKKFDLIIEISNQDVEKAIEDLNKVFEDLEFFVYDSNRIKTSAALYQVEDLVKYVFVDKISLLDSFVSPQSTSSGEDSGIKFSVKDSNGNKVESFAILFNEKFELLESSGEVKKDHTFQPGTYKNYHILGIVSGKTILYLKTDKIYYTGGTLERELSTSDAKMYDINAYSIDNNELTAIKDDIALTIFNQEGIMVFNTGKRTTNERDKITNFGLYNLDLSEFGYNSYLTKSFVSYDDDPKDSVYFKENEGIYFGGKVVKNMDIIGGSSNWNAAEDSVSYSFNKRNRYYLNKSTKSIWKRTRSLYENEGAVFGLEYPFDDNVAFYDSSGIFRIYHRAPVEEKTEKIGDVGEVELISSTPYGEEYLNFNKGSIEETTRVENSEDATLYENPFDIGYLFVEDGYVKSTPYSLRDDSSFITHNNFYWPEKTPKAEIFKDGVLVESDTLFWKGNKNQEQMNYKIENGTYNISLIIYDIGFGNITQEYVFDSDSAVSLPVVENIEFNKYFSVDEEFPIKIYTKNGKGQKNLELYYSQGEKWTGINVTKNESNFAGSMKPKKSETIRLKMKLSDENNNNVTYNLGRVAELGERLITDFNYDPRKDRITGKCEREGNKKCHWVEVSIICEDEILKNSFIRVDRLEEENVFCNNIPKIKFDGVANLVPFEEKADLVTVDEALDNDFEFSLDVISEEIALEPGQKKTTNIVLKYVSGRPENVIISSNASKYLNIADVIKYPVCSDITLQNYGYCINEIDIQTIGITEPGNYPILVNATDGKGNSDQDVLNLIVQEK